MCIVCDFIKKGKTSTNCPCCGDPIVFEKCNSLEEVLQREG